MSGPLLDFRGKVVEVRKQLIPKMYVTVVEDDSGKARIEFDTHQDLVVYREGERLQVTISKEVPEYREGEDYVVRATLVSTRQNEGGGSAYLFSAGGLLFIVELREGSLDVIPTEKYFIRIARV